MAGEIRTRRALVAVCAMAVLSMTSACTRSACDNRAYYGLPSPDGQWIAFIFHRTCPAPGGVTTQVSVLPFHESLRGGPGNVLAVAGEQVVQVSWHGPSTLWVTGGVNATYLRRDRVDGIRIEFH